MKKLVLGLVFASLPLYVACVKSSQCPDVKVVNGTAEDPIVVVINGEPVTETNFNKSLSGRDKGGMIKAESELFDAKMGALDEFVFNKLVEAEAKKKNITADEYLKKEIDGKLKAVKDSDVDKFYKDVKLQYEKNGKVAPPLNDAVKGQIKQQLSMKNMMERREKLNEELMRTNKVTYALEQPRIEVEVGTLPAKGADNAKVTIVEFSDFQCPYCKKGAATMVDVMKKFKGKVKYHFRDFPLSFHDRAKQASNAGRCAAEQGKFWEFHDKVFAEQGKLSDDDLIAVGKTLKLDMAKYEPCVKEMKHAAELDKDMEAGSNAGVTGTPAYFINGIFISGAASLKKFETIINKELKK